MKLTRRQLAALVAPAAVLAPADVLAQTQPAAAPGAPQDPLAAAKARIQSTSDALAKLDVPMSTEPAFQFRS